MNKNQYQKLVKECVRKVIVDKYKINESLQSDGKKLKQETVEFVNKLISNKILTSYHRDATSGDMNPLDFANDLVHDLLSTIQHWVKTVNDRGNWENDEGGMIK